MSQNCMDEGPNNETIKISIFHKFQHSPFWYLDQKYILHYFNKKSGKWSSCISDDLL